MAWATALKLDEYLRLATSHVRALGKYTLLPARHALMSWTRLSALLWNQLGDVDNGIAIG